MLAALAAHSLPRIQVTEIDRGVTAGIVTSDATVAGGGVGDNGGAAGSGTARGVVRRVLDLEGTPVVIEVEIRDGAVDLRLPESLDAGRRALAVAAVRRWLDLDQDPAAVQEALGGHPRLAPLLAARPGLRIVGHPDPFEAAVTTVLGQRVSLAAARVFGARFVELFAPSGGLVAFPSPAVVAAADPVELRAAVGVTGPRARCVVELAALCADGLDLLGDDPALVRERLLAVPGVGPWTVEYLAVRVLGDRDAYPSGDLVLQRALGVRTAQEADALSQHWRPWRAYALFHLWTAETYS